MRLTDNIVNCGGEKFSCKKYERGLLKTYNGFDVYVKDWTIYKKVGSFSHNPDFPIEKPSIDYVCYNDRYKIFVIDKFYFSVDVKNKKTVMIGDYIAFNQNYKEDKYLQSIVPMFYKYLIKHKDDSL